MDSATISPVDLMHASLEAVGDTDIVPLYFQRFFAAHPAEEANFYNRASSHGTMVNEMLGFLLALAEGEDWVPTMMRIQVLTHHDHGDIAVERYRDSLHLLVDVLADAAGDSWTPAFDRAWRDQAENLYALIESYY